jgi:integrase
LQRVLSVAKDRGLIAVNVCEKPGKLYQSNRRDKIWEDDVLGKAYASLPPHLADVLTLALWTGQRQGDLLRLPWSAYDGTHIRLKQSKREKPVLLKAGAPLRKMLDRRTRECPVILTTTRGTPWTGSGFRASWGKAIKAAGIEGLTFHDLRGSVATRLAIAGNSVPQIRSVTGHSLREAEAILNATYLSADQRLSEEAVTRLEGRFGEQKL